MATDGSRKRIARSCCQGSLERTNHPSTPTGPAKLSSGCSTVLGIWPMGPYAPATKGDVGPRAHAGRNGPADGRSVPFRRAGLGARARSSPHRTVAGCRVSGAVCAPGPYDALSLDGHVVLGGPGDRCGCAPGRPGGRRGDRCARLGSAARRAPKIAGKGGAQGELGPTFNFAGRSCRR